MPRVTGPITPTSVLDTYPTNDTRYGLGGLREVADHTARNAISTLRRREGMMVYTANDANYWRLLPSPWNNSDSDWIEVSAISAWGGVTGTLSDQTDLQTALDAKEDTANKGLAGGYPSLDVSGKVPAAQLPSYVDDVLEYADLASFPGTGTSGVIYVALDTNKTYRWSGSTYVEIVASAVNSVFGRIGGVVATVGDYTASLITNAPAGSLTGTTVQDALNELDAGKQPLDATLTALAGTTIAANKLVYGNGADSFATTDFSAFGRSLVDDADASAARTTLGAAPLNSPNFTGTPTAPTASSGANTTQIATTAFVAAGFQPLDIELSALAGLTSAADKLPYFTGSGTASVTTLSSWARTLLDDVDAPTARATLGVQGIAQAVIATVSSGFVADYYCDGTDDQVQIQAASNAVNAAGGGMVWVREGTYSINDSIIPKDNVWIHGSGMFSTIFAGTVNCITGIINGSTVTDCTLSDFKMDGTNMLSGSNIVTLKGINGQNWTRLRVENVYCYNTPASGFGSDFLIDSSFTNCIAENCGRQPNTGGHSGFGIGTGGFANESCQFVNCIAIGATYTGFLIEEQGINTFTNRDYQFQLTNCIATGNTHGFKIAGTPAVTMTNCKSYGNTEKGFYVIYFALRDIHDVKMIGCDSYENGTSGILWSNDNGEVSRNGEIIGGHVFNNGNWGIFSGGSTHLKVRDVYVFNNDWDGIKYYISDASGNVRKAVDISGNTVYNNGLNPSGAGTTHGIRIFAATGDIRGLSVKDNFIFDDQATPTQGFGVYASGSIYDADISGNQGDHLVKTGIYIDETDAVTTTGLRVNDNTMKNCGQGGTAFQNDGIRIIGSNASGFVDGAIFSGNRCYDDQVTKTQQYGLVLKSYIKNSLVTDNDFRGNAAGAINDGSDVSAGWTNQIVNNKGYNPTEPYANGTITGTTLTVNRANGDFQTMTLANNVTLTVTSGSQIGDRLVLMITQDGTGSRTITWPGNVSLTASSFVLSTSAGTTDTISFVWTGSTWRELSRSTARGESVTEGGTGKVSLTAYALLAGGTTSTGAMQQVSGLGSSGTVLTSNGASALPTWQSAPAPILSVGQKTANYTLTDSDDVIYATNSGITITLHDATTAKHKRYTIMNQSAGNISFATTSSQTVNGVTSGTIVPKQALVVDPDGTNWLIDSWYSPPTASYVTLGTDTTLTNERVLTGTANQIVITDNGAGGTVVLSTPQNIGTSSSPTFAGLTLSSALTVANGGSGAATLTGLLKGNGTSAFTAATAGTDYSAGTSALATGILKSTTTTGALSIAVAADFPTLNQNTTGSAATLTTARAIYGNNFDGSAALAQVIASTYGGTGNGFAKLTGPATSEKTFTLPNASATILTDNAAVTIAQGGTGQTTQTAAYNALSPTTTKGDIEVHNGTNVTRQAVGSNGQVLMADSAQTSGIKYADVAYTLQAFAASSNPADATTYFFGSRPTSAILTSGAITRIYIPRAGVVKAVYLYFSNSSTLGSNETSTVNFRLNNTTDTTISSAVTNDSVSTAFSNTALSITVAAGDYFEIKWVTPTWATNPLAVFPSAVVYIVPT